MAIFRRRTFVVWPAAVLAVLLVALPAFPAAQAQEATPGATAEASPEASPAATPDAVAEGPAEFVDGPWRVTVVAARHADELPEVELTRRTGRDWVLVVADVTNWSDDTASLRIADFGIRANGDTEPGGFAKQTTETVAATLGLQPVDADAEIELEEGETERLALVFQVDEPGVEPALAHDNWAIPLAGVIAAATDLGTLPPVTEAPLLREVSVRRIVAADMLEVSGDLRGNVRLVGVDPPAAGECFESDLKEALEVLVGTTLLIEGDAGSASGGGRYAWAVNRDGTRSLLNMQLVAGGYAAAKIDQDNRFHAWLTDVERNARLGPFGVWAVCTMVHGAERPEEADVTPFKVNLEGEKPYAPWLAWAPLIVATPDGGAWAFFSADVTARTDGSTKRLYASRYDPKTNKWATATPMPGGQVQFGVAAAVDERGQVHVVYSDRVADSENSLSTLVHTHDDGNGGWVDPVAVAPDPNAGHQLSPTLTFDRNGVLHVLFQDQRAFSKEDRDADAANADIFASELAPGDGQTWSEPVMIGERVDGFTNSRPHVAADGDRLVAVWSVYDIALGLGAAIRVEWATRPIDDPAGWATPAPLITGRGEQFGGRLLDLQADPTGGVALVFGRRGNDTFLFLRRLEPGRQEWGGDVLLVFGQGGTFPSLTINEVGTMYVTYNVGEGRIVDVGAVALAHGSIQPGPAVVLTSDLPETQGRAVVACDITGRPWVVYFNQPPDGDADEVRALRGVDVPT